MNRYLKLTGIVLIGWIPPLALLFIHNLLESAAILGPAPDRSSQAMFSSLFTSILSLFLGGSITGYLCSQEIKTKLGFVWITPGLYFVLLEAALFIHYADIMMPGLPELMLAVAVTVFLISWGGVGVGHYIRCEILRPAK